VRSLTIRQVATPAIRGEQRPCVLDLMLDSSEAERHIVPHN